MPGTGVSIEEVKEEDAPSIHPWKFPRVKGHDSYYDLTLGSHHINGERLANAVARLFMDYADKGTGIKQCIFFHAGRNHTDLANHIALVLLNSPPFIAPHRIQEIIQRNVREYRPRRGGSDHLKFNKNGSFWRRCQFALDLCSDQAGSDRVIMGAPSETGRKILEGVPGSFSSSQ